MGRLTGLDALRGIAAAIVLAFHFGDAFGWPWLFPKGYLAVDFFFLLSGYVLSRTYDARMKGRLRPADFFRTRVKRLWPTMAFGTLLASPMLFLYPPELAFLLLVTSLFFLPFLVSGTYFPLNAPQWSILFELFANVLHALLLHRLRTRQLIFLVAVSALLFGLAAAVKGDLDVGGQVHNILAGIPRVLMSYSIGLLVWRHQSRLPPLRSFALASAVALPLVIAAAGWIPEGAWIADLAIVVAIFPMILVAGLHWDAGQAGSIMGEWSFPLYAFHYPLINAAILAGFGWPTALAASLVFSIGAIVVRNRFLKQQVPLTPAVSV